MTSDDIGGVGKCPQGKKSAQKQRMQEFFKYLLWLVLGGVFFFMGLTQPTYRERKSSSVTLVLIGAVFAGIFILCVGCEISLLPAVQKSTEQRNERNE